MCRRVFALYSTVVHDPSAHGVPANHVRDGSAVVGVVPLTHFVKKRSAVNGR